MATAEQLPISQVDGSIVLEARRGGLAVAVVLRYGFIRELRGFLKAPGDSASGMLFGRYASDGATIEHCVEGDRVRTPIGLFRTQPGGFARLTAHDCSRIQSAIPATAPGALFLVVRTHVDRPWSATLFAVDPRQPSPAEPPLLEFPLDEYLLRNGWFNEQTAASGPAPQTVQTAAPRPRRLAPWIALAAAAVLIGAGAAVRSFWVRPQLQSFTPAAETIALNVARSVDELEVSWNRAAAAVRSATSGTLTIHNGPVTRTVAVTAQQLREGRIMYHPIFGADTDFRLEVRTADGRSVAESFQVLNFGAEPPLSFPIRLTPISDTPRPPAPERRPRRTSDRADASADAAPTEAVPLRRVNPVMTPKVVEEAQSAHGKVSISVSVAIDATGSVQTAKVVSSTGEPSGSGSYMRLASLNAAKQWKFRPATAGGKPTSSSSTLVFNF